MSVYSAVYNFKSIFIVNVSTRLVGLLMLQLRLSVMKEAHVQSINNPPYAYCRLYNGSSPLHIVMNNSTKVSQAK
jgi:hypothetical protein